jgi:hypothetical protein
MAKFVIDVCVGMGLEIVYSPPSFSCLSSAQACFITSTSRLVCPVQTVLLQVGEWDYTASMNVEELKTFVIEPDSIMMRIREAVLSQEFGLYS